MVDCLTLWASNLMLAEINSGFYIDAAVEAIVATKTPLILVSNKVGSGIVPVNALAREFRDLAGTVNQRMAAAVRSPVLIVAGYPVTLIMSSVRDQGRSDQPGYQTRTVPSCSAA